MAKSQMPFEDKLIWLKSVSKNTRLEVTNICNQ